MKHITSHIHHKHPDLFLELKRNLCLNTISDINSPINQYSGDVNFLAEMGIIKKNSVVETLISRIEGNIGPHFDAIDEYKKDVYLLVLDVSTGNKHRDSQRYPLLYQNREFIKLRKGDLVRFNQNITHALLWDRRIDIATFWIRKQQYVFT